MDQNQNQNKSRFEAIVLEIKKHPIYVFTLIILTILAAWNNMIGIGILNRIGDSVLNSAAETTNTSSKKVTDTIRTEVTSQQSAHPLPVPPSGAPIATVTDTTAGPSAQNRVDPNISSPTRNAFGGAISTPTPEQAVRDARDVYLKVSSESASINYMNTISRYLGQQYNLSQEKNAHLSVFVNIIDGNAYSIDGAQTKGIASFESCPRFSVQVKNNDTQKIEKQLSEEKICYTSQGIPDSGTTAQNRAAAQVAQRILSFVTEVTNQGL